MIKRNFIRSRERFRVVSLQESKEIKSLKVHPPKQKIPLLENKKGNNAQFISKRQFQNNFGSHLLPPLPTRKIKIKTRSNPPKHKGHLLDDNFLLMSERTLPRSSRDIVGYVYVPRHLLKDYNLSVFYQDSSKKI